MLIKSTIKESRRRAFRKRAAGWLSVQRGDQIGVHVLGIDEAPQHQPFGVDLQSSRLHGGDDVVDLALTGTTDPDEWLRAAPLAISRCDSGWHHCDYGIVIEANTLQYGSDDIPLADGLVAGKPVHLDVGHFSPPRRLAVTSSAT